MTTLWYIWRARNDLRFKNRKWSVLQVQFAVDAKINAVLQQKNKAESIFNATASQMNGSSYAGTQVDTANQICGQQFVCCLPGSLSGTRSYIDASTPPDDPALTPRVAGLGIFILDPAGPSKIFIKAQVRQINGVRMAEVASLALAAMIVSRLNVMNPSFLTDNLILAAYFNSSDLGSPPRWDIRPFTQRVLNIMANSSYRVLKIHRSFNTTAHILAHQAFRTSEPQCNWPTVSCSNVSLTNGCPLNEVLRLVNRELFTPIAATCC